MSPTARTASATSASDAVGSGEGQVVADGAGEEERLLGDDAELAAQRVQRHALDVVAVDAHVPGGGVVEAGDQLGQGGLAGPGGPDEGHRLPRRDAQVDVAQHGHVGVVAEGHVVEDDLPLDGGQLHGVGRLGDGGLGREQGAQLEDRGLALLEAVVLLHQQLDGGEEAVQVQEEGHQGADG